MTILPLKTGGGRELIPVLLALSLSVSAPPAGVADEIPVGILPAGDKVYTNAIITRVTPAYAVVSYQEGMAQIPLSNLPAAYQTRFGYSPEKAAQFLDEERQIQKKRRAAFLAQQATLRTLAGTNRPVRIMAIDDHPYYGGFSLCSVDLIKGGMLVENFPDSVRQFMSGYRQLQADVAGCQQQLNKLNTEAKTLAKPPPPPSLGKSGNRAVVLSVYSAQTNNLANNRRNLENRLQTLNAQLDRATTNYDLYTTIIAHPSGQAYAGKPIWVCVGVPAAATR